MSQSGDQGKESGQPVAGAFQTLMLKEKLLLKTPEKLGVFGRI